MIDLTRRVHLLVGLLAIVTATAILVPSAAAAHATKAATTTTTSTVPTSAVITHTFGATNPTITQAAVASTICKLQYVDKIKSQISKKTSTEVFTEYAIAKKKRGDYAIDHLVPPDLGGTNALTNLWPIPLKGTDTPQRKAVVDAAVHKSMCEGFISLSTAQGLFDASWPSVDTNLVTPSPTVSQPLWFWSDTGELAPLFRVAVTVSNPGLEPISGVQTSWNALDASGTLVGSYSSTLPVINALSSWTYVGGAGSSILTGNPASATVVASKKGSYVKQVATSYATDSIQFGVSPYGIYTGATDYNVTSNITIGASQIPKTSLDVIIILTNAAGQVVGADNDSDPSNLPAVLTPGLRFAIQGDVPATSMPTSATIYAAPEA